MRILHITRDYESNSVYKKINENSCELNHFFVPVSFFSLKKNFTISNVHYIKSIFTIFHGLYFIKAFLLRYFIRRYIRSNYRTYSHTHAHFLFYEGDIANFLFKKYKLPFTVTVRAADIVNISVFNRYLVYEILNNSDNITFVSNSVKQNFFKKLNCGSDKWQSKCHIIYNGIDEFWLKNINRESNIRKSYRKEFVVLTVAEIVPNKNQISVCYAVEELLKLGFSIRYICIGHIIDKSYFEKLCKFSFFEHLKNKCKEELINFYRLSDLFIMPSFTETFGISYIESLSQARPIIFAKQRGIDGIFIDQPFAVGVDPNNIHDIELSIFQLLNFEHFNFEEIDFERLFSWKEICKSYSKLYSNQ